MLCPYLLGQYCLHLTFKPYLSSETYSRKYEKLPNIVIHSCKNETEKMYFLKMSGPQIWHCLFTFRAIVSKNLNGLTTIDTLRWLGGAVVTHHLWMQKVPGSIPNSSNGFYVFLFVIVVFYFVVKNTLFVTKVCNSFYNFIYLVYLRYCKIYDRL